MKLFGLFILTFSFLASAQGVKLSTTYDRMTVRSFDGFGMVCKDAKQRAMLGCNAWLAEISDDYEVTGSAYCRSLECSCAITEDGAHAKCLGQAPYLATIDSEEIDGKMVGEKRGCPLKTDPILRSVGTGIDCWEADHAAKMVLFPKLERLSDDVDILDLRPVVCSCKHGFPSYAACKVTAHALWAKSVPWDAPSCH